MLVVTIAAILLGIGVPALNSMVRANELKSAKSTVLATLSFARGEATARREQIIACSSTNGASCSGSTDWTNGWIIYQDANEDNALTTDDCNPTTDCLLRVQGALSGQVTLNGSGNYLGYTNIGTRVTTGSNSLTLCRDDAEDANDTGRSYGFQITDAGLNRLNDGTATCP